GGDGGVRGGVVGGGEESGRLEALGKERLAHVGDDLRRQRGRAPEHDEAGAARGGTARQCGRRGGLHSSGSSGVNAEQGRKFIKMISFGAGRSSGIWRVLRPGSACEAWRTSAGAKELQGGRA